MRTTWFLAVTLLLLPLSARAVDYVNDPLTSDSAAGRGGSRGGTFSSQGWTTSAGTDSVWYEISDALESATIEYTVTGLEVGVTLSGADHDLLAVYQAPEGVGEPVAYAPYFRNNDMKVFTRTFGTLEPDRPGSMKLELHACMVGAPYYDNTCPAECGIADGLAYANGNQNDLGWNPATAYRMGLSWGGGMMNLSRDGVTLASIPYNGTYAPRPLRVRIGSPRHDEGPYQAMPVGITIKDVVIRGTPGAMSLVCGAEPPDAGVAPMDAGAAPDAGGGVDAGQVVIDEGGALQDVTAASWELGVFPDVNDLNVEADTSGTPQAVVYLRFPPLTGPVQRATLRMHTQFTSSAAGGSGEVCVVNDFGWSETSLVWADRPAVTSLCAGTEHLVFSDEAVEWDVTSLMATGLPSINLAVVSHDDNGAHYFSRESGGTALGPRLLVERAAGPVDAGQPVDASVRMDGATVSPDAAVNPDAGSGVDAGAARMDGGGSPGADAGSSGGADGGAGSGNGACGCMVPGDADPRWGAVLLVLGAWRSRRRRAGA